MFPNHHHDFEKLHDPEVEEQHCINGVVRCDCLGNKPKTFEAKYRELPSTLSKSASQDGK